MNRYLIGIDTGGTFTDAVLIHYTTREVVSAAKSLTTRKDLKKGVIKVLNKLEIPQNCTINLVGISSTLATNSIAEGKAKKVALLLIGYKPELIENFGLKGDFATEDISFIEGGHDAQGKEIGELNEEDVKKWINEKKNQVDAVAVSSYFSPINPEHEEIACKIIGEESDLPVVMGHQLSTKLNSVKRAATASINASLVAVMQDFLQSVKNSLNDLKVDAPLMIVRGDGSLMPFSEAVQKPVETVLSGPAASAIGGIFLSGKTHSLVIDMGSTTTDMAIVNNAKVVVSDKGARVGDTQTAVEAAKIRTVSVGCDSRISIDNKKEIIIGPERVRALSQIAMYHPHVKETILDMQDNKWNQIRSAEDIEFWYYHTPLDAHTEENLNSFQKSVLKELEKPCQLSNLMEEFNVSHHEHLQMEELRKQGFIETSGLNPSDLLHVTSDMDLWDTETAEVATKAYCDLIGSRKSDFIKNVFNKIVDNLVEEILLYVACKDIDPQQMPVNIDGKWGKWMLKEILYHHNDLLSLEATSTIPIIGTGAPAKHFLKEVSNLLNTKLFLPEYSAVANAVGAVSGSVSETREAIVFIHEDQEHFSYKVKSDGKYESFDKYEEACKIAEDRAYMLAKKAAIEASGSDPYIEVERKSEGSFTRFIARAFSNPRLSNVGKSFANE